MREMRGGKKRKTARALSEIWSIFSRKPKCREAFTFKGFSGVFEIFYSRRKSVPA